MYLATAGDLSARFGKLSQLLDQIPKSLENPAQP